ncbi:MAG: hypothetical protein A2083_07335 [Gemmatimonadetes bacterium GWC2_71_9]|nr:MAG: hypothetical protein A3I79_06415 [Gemmatimonadetes bacterium RIFCSPLOWO2_02_FULL_71_11]OGT94972.1 MAG: hypothetical protein A2083_07335 [Gemmatimonadetes bacterium GWC2_71_9]
MRTLLAKSGLLLALLPPLTAGAALRAQESAIILPATYDPTRSHPIVILLPFTSGNAGRLLSGYVSQAVRDAGGASSDVSGIDALLDRFYPGGAGREELAFILACGFGHAEDYATEDAWSATIVRCEDEILADLGVHAAHYSLDTTRVVLAGYSMGGDLAWALTLRNPRRFLGAIVMGSRASYRTAAARMAALATRDARITFTLGDHEEEVRLSGARAAAALLERHGVAHRHVLVPGSGHDPAPLTEFGQALRFVLGEPPSRPPPGSAGRWLSVAAGASHACALAADSTAHCWGVNGVEGRLGDGTTDSSGSYPAPVAGGHRFRSLSTTADHTCGVVRDGRVVCWGDNTGFKLGDQTDSSRTRPVHAGPHPFAMVDAGARYTCAAHQIGTLYCWGTDSIGLLAIGRVRSRYPIPVTQNRRIPAVSTGYDYSCALDADSVAWCWGAGFFSSRIPAVTNLLQLSYTLRFRAITTGAGFACGLTADGTAYCWGYSRGGNLGTGRRATNSYAPVLVAGGHRFLALDAGENHVCGVTTDHAAYCWGRNDHDQLGVAFGATRDVPSPVLGGLRFVSVSAGKDFTCGVTVSGALWCWGENGQGQLGAGHQWDLNRPVTVQNPREASRPSR